VWNVDVTLRVYTYPKTWTACQYAPQPGSAFFTTMQIEGNVDPTQHLIYAIAALPWSTEWISVVVPDWLGLCWQADQCQWTQATGTELGVGNGSQAQFATGTTLLTTVQVSTCGALSIPDAKADCLAFPPFDPYSAQISSSGITAESNNLTTNFNIFVPTCWRDSCQQTFTSQR
jgi:hypothetical protein